jgi:2-polyprenyl-6-methoxyphenol hydroxylase-like FAD-dependent oxidoreductase
MSQEMASLLPSALASWKMRLPSATSFSVESLQHLRCSPHAPIAFDDARFLAKVEDALERYALDYILRGRAAGSKPRSRQNYAEAISLCERALALDPRSVEAQSMLAGRVTLLGDAAHPMYPVGGNGSSQAITAR